MQGTMNVSAMIARQRCGDSQLVLADGKNRQRPARKSARRAF
jgi:hypothetical protein